ncbi:MAG: cell division protein ZapA [Nitrospiraceae bacterium]
MKLVQDVKRKNASLEDELRLARERLATRDDENRRWERERLDIRSRIEKVLEIEVLECLDTSKEGIEVEIYGQRYTVNGDADESYVRRLAEIVDKQMKNVSTSMKTAASSWLSGCASILPMNGWSRSAAISRVRPMWIAVWHPSWIRSTNESTIDPVPLSFALQSKKCFVIVSPVSK